MNRIVLGNGARALCLGKPITKDAACSCEVEIEGRKALMDDVDLSIQARHVDMNRMMI